MGRVVVYHTSYGCETGCCGHYVELDGKEVIGSFAFDHPYGQDPVEFAKEMVEETFGKDHCHDLDWNDCLISED